MKTEVDSLGEEQLGEEEVRRGGRRASDRAKKRVNRFMVRFVRERRASRLSFLSLGLGHDSEARREAEM